MQIITIVASVDAKRRVRAPFMIASESKEHNIDNEESQKFCFLIADGKLISSIWMVNMSLVIHLIILKV